MLSKSCEYGLRAALYIASLDQEEEYISIGTISEELGISFPFLTKILQKLNDAGLLTSQRGPKGGVALTQPADEVTLHEIVVAIEGDDLFQECVLGLPGCGDAEPCPLHDEWVAERGRIKSLFQDATLAELPDVRLAALD
jgi:Rrf2 family iron-sulfur cluster assembly transcriptional regulator